MKKDLPIIKLFQNENQYYVYDTFTNSILHISKEHYIDLKKLSKIGIKDYLSQNDTEQPYCDIISLIKSGFFKPCFIETKEHPDTPKIYDLITRSLNYMILQVTRDCNFDCIYCQYARNTPIERNHSCEQMSLSIAEKAVNFLYDHSKNVNSINIGFYGGEPLLNYSLIKKVVEYSQNKFETKHVGYNITTNGSLLTEESINFLIENDFSLLISLDGPQDIQNRHRRYRNNLNNTYESVIKKVYKIKELNELYFQKKVRFNPVIMPDEDPNIVIDFFNSLSIAPEKCNLLSANLCGVDYFYQSEFIKGITHNKSADYFNKKSNEDIYKRYKNKAPLSEIHHHNGPCVPMLNRFFVNCYGDIFTCEKIIESDSAKLGNVAKDSSLDFTRIENMLNIGKLTEEQCQKCYAFRLCSICAISCFDPESHSLSSKQKLEACQQMKKSVDNFLLNYAKERTK